MKTLTLTEPSIAKEIIAQQLTTLREYASKIVLNDGHLTLGEAADQVARMRQFLAAGQSFDLTHKEMVRLLLEELFQKKPECGCHSCKTKNKA